MNIMITNIVQRGEYCFVENSNGRRIQYSIHNQGEFLGVFENILLFQRGNVFQTYDENGNKLGYTSHGSVGNFCYVTGNGIVFDWYGHKKVYNERFQVTNNYLH
jgi:hypothetical protein